MQQSNASILRTNPNDWNTDTKEQLEERLTKINERLDKLQNSTYESTTDDWEETESRVVEEEDLEVEKGNIKEALTLIDLVQMIDNTVKSGTERVTAGHQFVETFERQRYWVSFLDENARRNLQDAAATLSNQPWQLYWESLKTIESPLYNAELHQRTLTDQTKQNNRSVFEFSDTLWEEIVDAMHRNKPHLSTIQSLLDNEIRSAKPAEAITSTFEFSTPDWQKHNISVHISPIASQWTLHEKGNSQVKRIFPQLSELPQQLDELRQDLYISRIIDYAMHTVRDKQSSREAAAWLTDKVDIDYGSPWSRKEWLHFKAQATRAFTLDPTSQISMYPPMREIDHQYRYHKMVKEPLTWALKQYLAPDSYDFMKHYDAVVKAEIIRKEDQYERIFDRLLKRFDERKTDRIHHYNRVARMADRVTPNGENYLSQLGRLRARRLNPKLASDRDKFHHKQLAVNFEAQQQQTQSISNGQRITR
jgi:hypothetical protein